MIIYRYISRQLFAATLGISFVLVLIFFSGRFIKYLSYAAEGRLDGSAIFMVMGYRLPGFLELILPLGLFLGILLSYGRLYIESEMTVLNAAGVSQWQITKHTILPAIYLTLAVGTLSLYVTPWGAQRSDTLLYEAKANSQFDILTPGIFHVLKKEGRVTYAQSISSDKKEMVRLFLAEQSDVQQTSIIAARGFRLLDPDTGIEYLQLHDGFRYQGLPGEADYQVTRFGSYAVKVSEPEIAKELLEVKVMPTVDLIHEDSLLAKSELQWRISLPLLVPIVVLMAIPLSRVNPRQGRYLKMLPSIMGYLAYLSLLITSRGWIEKGKVPVEVGMWPVHVLFFTIAILLHWFPGWLQKKRALHGKITPNVASA